MSYLVWLSIAVGLLIIEIVAPAFFFIFFAASSLLVAALSYFSVIEDSVTQIIVFSLVAIISLFLMRKRFAESLKAPGIANFGENEHLKLDCDIAPNMDASISYQGSTWTAFNSSDRAMKSGETVTIARIDGVKLILKHKE